ncbi:TonB-dependent receptor domain-containing protein [Hyphococcus sp.]|uniref:TonB-dependent receptor domain-containing protein n=1 Tax=Hyphococcus sp. TaxID=2038636 RepID=UPI00207D83AE|nr:MAG: TonB-dependent receptor [Marinicaulis sp.]
MKSYRSLGGMLFATTMLFAPHVVAQDGAEAGATTDSGIVLSIQPTYTDEIIVRGRNIPNPQRATSQVATFLGEEDLARAGDSNAALALTRLSGLSVVGGKFAYVRGLGDRYSSARLNGSPLPSPEPLRRTVPLDLFPANILGGATVQKTFSANYPGEFGGGIIDLQTVRDPGESFLDVKLGVSMDTVTTGREGLFVYGGDLDWLGYDDGLRDIPGPIQGLIDTGVSLNDLSDADLEIAGESFVNSPLSVIQSGSLGPNFEGSVEGGWSKDLDSGLTIGFVGVLGYKQDWTTENSKRQFVNTDIIGLDFDVIETSLDATVNSLGSFSLGWDNHSVQATGLYIHSSRKEAQIRDGFDFNTPAATGTQDVRDESSSWLERQLLMGQLSGQHVFGDIDVNWRGAYAKSKRDSPYERSLRRHYTPEGLLLYSEANQYDINFSDLNDTTKSGGIDFTYNMPISGAREVALSVGYEYVDNEREANVYNFRFAGGNSIPLDVQSARPDFLFSPDNIDPLRFELIETSITGTESYLAGLTVHGVYAQADMELIPTLRTTVGVRYEDAEEIVATFDRFGNTGPGALLDNTYWLPTAAVTWNFLDDMQIRVAYSQTIARPQFRELAPSLFFDPDNDRSYRGSTALIDSKFKNYDARYEYYLGRNQFLTLGGFYKEIDRPIEEVLFEQASFVFNSTFINSPKATLYGGEFEYRMRFDIGMNEFTKAREWLFTLNYTYTKSKIVVNPGDQIIDPFSGALRDATLFGLDGAQLQGTPEHIANAQFGWEGERDQFTILVGWVDKRILQRGDPTTLGGVPDVIEEPGIQLDVVFRQDITIHGTDFTIGLSARNLLGTDHEEYQLSGLGRTEFDSYKRGRSLSASLTAKF